MKTYKIELVFLCALPILIFNFSIVRSQPYMPIKPLSTFDMGSNERVVIGISAISDELQRMPPMKLLKSGKIDELKQESDKLMTFLSCLQQFTIKSEPYSIKEWLDNDGQLIKIELERAMRKFAFDLNILLNMK